jgi:periplasmic copper chaperone A
MKRACIRTWLYAVLGCLPVVASGAGGDATNVRADTAWTRATPPGVDAAAVYLLLHGGDKADRLLAVRTMRASMAQVHTVSADAGVTRMRETQGIDVPARATVQFAPQGRHIMLMGLKSPLVPGERFALTLSFASGGSSEVVVEVVPPTASGPAPR